MIITKRNNLLNKTYRNVITRPIVVDIFGTTLLGIIGNSVGFLIPLFIGAWFGVTSSTDAFFLVYGLIFFIANIFASAVESVIVPFIHDSKKRGMDYREFVCSILISSSTYFLILALFIAITARPLMQAFTNLPPEVVSDGYLILIEILPLLFLISWTATLNGTLNSFKIFWAPALSPLLRGTVVLLTVIFLKDILGIHAVALGFLAGELLRLYVSYLILKRKTDFVFSIPRNKSTASGSFVQTAGYQMVSAAIVGLNPLIDRIVASWMGEGSVSLIEYSEKLFFLPSTLFTIGLIKVVLSYWSFRSYEIGFHRLKSDVQNALKIVGGIALLVTFFVYIFRDFYAEIAFSHGGFPLSRIPEVSAILGMYILGLPPLIMAYLLVNGLMVMKGTKVIMKMGIIINLSNIVLDILLAKLLGVKGIALASTFVYLLTFVLMYIAFNREFNKRIIHE